MVNNKEIDKIKRKIDLIVEELESSHEQVLLKDLSSGFSFQASSRKYDALQLSDLGTQIFRKWKAEKLNKIPLGVE